MRLYLADQGLNLKGAAKQPRQRAWERVRRRQWWPGQLRSSMRRGTAISSSIAGCWPWLRVLEGKTWWTQIFVKGAQDRRLSAANALDYIATSRSILDIERLPSDQLTSSTPLKPPARALSALNSFKKWHRYSKSVYSSFHILHSKKFDQF